MSIRRERVVLQILRRADELPLPLDARAVERNVDLEIFLRLCFIHPQICAGVVDNVLAIGVRRSAVIVLVVCMALQIVAAWEAGIDVSDALVVRNKIDAFAYPHRRGEISLCWGEELEVTVAISVNPDLPGGAAAVAFPARWIPG